MAGIYLHIPFCKRACHYCNFHFSTSLQHKNEFVTALLKEMGLRRDYLGNEKISSIYFGGGTPSLLSSGDIAALLENIQQFFEVDEQAEISLEANPDDLDDATLLHWRKSGVNRLSIGTQSFFDEDLVWMNRVHTAKQSVEGIQKAQDAGFQNISIDLIYGMPVLPDERWQQTVETAVGLGIPHLSCYALTVESRTALYKMIEQKKTAAIDPDHQANQFLLLIGWLEKAGYEHYEISSFSKPGQRSRHNSSYWQSKKYLGLGPSAHSFDGYSRQWNISNNLLYIQAVEKQELLFEKEILSQSDQLNEYIMTALRTKEGIDLDHIRFTFGSATESVLEKNAGRYILNRQLKNENARIFLTHEGKLFADGIAASLFF